jgi:hypothetical protein
MVHREVQSRNGSPEKEEMKEVLRMCDLASILGGLRCIGPEVGTRVGLGWKGLGFSLCAVLYSSKKPCSAGNE